MAERVSEIEKAQLCEATEPEESVHDIARRLCGEHDALREVEKAARFVLSMKGARKFEIGLAVGALERALAAPALGGERG